MTTRTRHLTMSTSQKVKYVMCVDGPLDQPFGDPSRPTLLAFHGSGSNSTCHRVQLARLNMVLKKNFNILVFHAPFESPAGPGILPFFDGCGPFARWLPPTEKVTIEAMRLGQSTGSMAPEVEGLVKETVQALRKAGGRVVGLIGFSQGTKVVAGLLRGTQIRKELQAAGQMDGSASEDTSWCDFSFAVSVCASYPPPLVPHSISNLLDASSMEDSKKEEVAKQRINIPVYHVQGKQDEWKWAGESLLGEHYAFGSEGSVREELDMGHQYPVKPEENETIGRWCVEQLGRAKI